MSERGGDENRQPSAVEDEAAAAPQASSQAAPQQARTAAAPRQPRRDPMIIVGKLVKAAIKDMHQQNGSSLRAIKKHIARNYRIHRDDYVKLGGLIKQYLKSAVQTGELIAREVRDLEPAQPATPESSQSASPQPESSQSASPQPESFSADDA